MMKHAPEWVRTSDPVIRSSARYLWTTVPASKLAWTFILLSLWINDTGSYFHCIHGIVIDTVKSVLKEYPNFLLRWNLSLLLPCYAVLPMIWTGGRYFHLSWLAPVYSKWQLLSVCCCCKSVCFGNISDVAWEKMHFTWFSRRDGFSPTRHQILPSPLRGSGQDTVSSWEKTPSLLENHVKCISSPVSESIILQKTPFYEKFLHSAPQWYQG